jgi:hypothetical protein
MLRPTYLLIKAAKTLLILGFVFVQLVATAAQAVSGCAELIQRAMNTLRVSCAELGRNQACYGNQSVNAILRDNSLAFNAIGHRVDVAYIESLTASAFNHDTGDWGLSLLKLKVNLPDTLPGANVTFLVHGGTSVENVSGDMQVFYFTSSLGEPQCSELPRSSIVVQSPNHERITFVANGVQISMGSTVVLSAQPNNSMEVYLIEGSANLTTYGQTVSLQPNQKSSIPLGGTDGLTAIGAPSIPTQQVPDATTENLLATVNELSGEDTDSSTPGNTSVPGLPTLPDNGGAGNGQGNTGTDTKAESGKDKTEKQEEKQEKKEEKKEEKQEKKEEKGKK